MIRVEEVNDVHELASYRLLWNALLGQTRRATFFQSLDWLSVYWKHFGQDQRLRVLIVTSNGSPVGILPLVVRTEPTRVGPVRVLTYPLHDWGTFYGPIGPNPTATLTAALRHVRQTRRDWDMLDLRWVDLKHDDRGRTAAAMQRIGFYPRKQGWNQAPVVDMACGWDEYWNGRPRKWRHNVFRLRRRLGERGTVAHVRYRPEGATRGDADPRWDLFDACVKIARKSWQASSTDGTTLCHGSVGAFLREAHLAASQAGAIDLNLLLLDEKPIAFVYNYHYRGRVYGLRKGFDPQYAAAGPGTVLQYLMLQDSFRREDRCYDMGAGSLDGKRYWQTSLVTSYRFTHFPLSTARAQLLRIKRWFQDRIHGPQYLACAARMA